MNPSRNTTTTAPEHSGWAMLFWALPLGYLWLKVILHLRLEWTVNPQYNYGWAVPFLSALLIWRAAQRPQPVAEIPVTRAVKFLWLALAGGAALLWFPARLVDEANPDWRFASWALALVPVMLTLATVRLRLGRAAWRSARFGVLFFLVAVPWPTLVEGPLVQALTRFNAAACIEVLTLFGVPALQHGNVIEVSTGVVGIEEACSGIRSFQASLMIALFLGEYYTLRPRRRIGLVLAGFALAILFNLGRTTLLVLVASRQGVAAVDAWHDPAGVTILVGCFLGVWALAEWLKPRLKKLSPGEPARFAPPSGTVVPAVALLAWLLAAESAVAAWYRSHERAAVPQPAWTVAWPTNAAEFRPLELAPRVRQLLRYDAGANAQWRDADGTRVQVIFFRWLPGRVAAKLARSHTPEICLSAAGGVMQAEPRTQRFTVHGLPLEFEVYEFEGLRAYYCLWADRENRAGSSSVLLTYHNRWRAVRLGLRNLGQRSLEVALWTRETPTESDARLAAMLPGLLRVEAATP